MITIIQTTSSDKQELESLLDYLVKNNKAACGHVELAIASVYRWEGEVKHANEFTLRVKTTATCCAEVVEYLTSNHSYDLPEVTWWEVNTTPDYQKWVEGEVRT